MGVAWQPPTRRVLIPTVTLLSPIPSTPPSPFFSFTMSAPADLEFTDLSDLTELSSDDEARSSITKSSKGKQPAKDSFVLKNTLRPPRSVSYTTKWLHGAVNHRSSIESLSTVSLLDQLTLQHIDLDPEYQVTYSETSRLSPYKSSSARCRLARNKTSGPD